MRLVQLLAAVVLACSFIQPAHSALVFDFDASAQGSGFAGQAVMVLGRAGDESGCVDFSNQTGSGACDSSSLAPRLGASFPYTAGTFAENNGQTQIRTVAESGALHAWDFRIILNLNQGTGNPLTVNDMVVKFYNPSGTLVWHSAQITAFTPVVLTEGGGTGSSGKIFSLQDPDSSALQAAVFSQPNFGQYLIGIEVTASGGASGNEGISVTRVGITDTPEPGTWWLLGAGLVFLGALAKRR